MCVKPARALCVMWDAWQVRDQTLIMKQSIFWSKCETFHMKMSSAYSYILMQIKVIFIRMVSHLDSLWNRGTGELGNGLFLCFVVKDLAYLTLGAPTFENSPLSWVARRDLQKSWPSHTCVSAVSNSQVPSVLCRMPEDFETPSYVLVWTEAPNIAHCRNVRGLGRVSYID